MLIQFVSGIKCSRTQNNILNDDKITTFDKATVVATTMELTNNYVNMLRNNHSEGNIKVSLIAIVNVNAAEGNIKGKLRAKNNT